MKSSTLRKYLKEKIKIGRRTFGEVYELPSGRSLYLTKRKTIAMFRDGVPNHSAAIRENKAFWSIEDDVVRTLRLKNVNFVGIHVRESEDMYICSLDRFVKEARYLPRAQKFDHPQKFLPVGAFAVQLGSTKL
jgi:hypothetical protein